jgi:hypothetical protein
MEAFSALCSRGSKLRTVTTLRDPGVMDESADLIAERPDAGRD